MIDREGCDDFADALRRRRRVAQSSARALASRARATSATRRGNARPVEPPTALWAEATALVERTLRDLSAAEEELYARSEALFEARVELGERQRRYLELFELAPAGYLVTDPTGRIVEANAVGAAMLGRPRNAIVGQSICSFVAPGERSAFGSAIARARRASGVEEWPVRLMTGEGFELEVSASVRSVAGPEGGVHELYWLLRDESARYPDDLL
jgi:PAS domain S-box-containing protein